MEVLFQEYQTTIRTLQARVKGLTAKLHHSKLSELEQRALLTRIRLLQSEIAELKLTMEEIQSYLSSDFEKAEMDHA
jgi:predicted RNase H-like nuclease (RuvC/YqgF family)